METDLSQRKMEQSAGTHQFIGYKKGAYCLREQCGDGDAHDAHMEHKDKNHVQNDVDDTAYDQDVQRIPGVPGCAKDSGAHIVYEYEQDTCKINPQIHKRIRHDLCRCIHEPEHERCGQYADKCERNPAGHSDRICIVETCICCIFFPCPCVLGDGVGSARGKYGEETDYQGNDLRRGTAHTGKRFLPYKLTYDHTVNRIVKLLEKCSEQDREKEQQKLFPDDSFCDFIFCLTYCFHNIPSHKTA